MKRMLLVAHRRFRTAYLSHHPASNTSRRYLSKLR